MIVFGLIPLIFLYIAYAFVYQRIRNRQYEQAKTPLLLLAIIEIIFGGVLPGIFYIIAYVKLGDVINESRQMMGPQPGWGQPPMAQPYNPAPAAYPSPPGGQPAPVPQAAPAPMAAPAPNCPRCGRPATFVPQYNRYYCYTDQQYV